MRTSFYIPGSYVCPIFFTQISSKVWHMIHRWTHRDLGFLLIWKLFPNIFSILSAFISRPFSRKPKRVLKKRIISPCYALSQLSNKGLLVLGGQKLAVMRRSISPAQNYWTYSLFTIILPIISIEIYYTTYYAIGSMIVNRVYIVCSIS